MLWSIPARSMKAVQSILGHQSISPFGDGSNPFGDRSNGQIAWSMNGLTCPQWGCLSQWAAIWTFWTANI